MSKAIKIFALLALLVGTAAVTVDTADARPWFRSYYWGGGWGPYYGGGPFYGRPYYYGGPYYYYGSRCSSVRVLVRRHGHRVWRRAWRCW